MPPVRSLRRWLNADDESLAILERLVAHRDRLDTLTLDNGEEFACYTRIDTILRYKSYFTHPLRLGERGLNENTNELIHLYLPMQTEIDRIQVH